jgi:hypothetical protein
VYLFNPLGDLHRSVGASDSDYLAFLHDKKIYKIKIFFLSEHGVEKPFNPNPGGLGAIMTYKT